MTAAIAFDTHRFVKRLTECGFTERQAETLADEHVALLNANLATKTDIAEIKAGIDRVQAATKAEIVKAEGATKAEIVKVAASVETSREETRAEIAKVAASVETSRQQAKAEIAKIEASVETSRQQTKAEIAKAESAFKTEVAKVEARIQAVKADLLKWMFGAMIAQCGLIVALIKLL